MGVSLQRKGFFGLVALVALVGLVGLGEMPVRADDGPATAEAPSAGMPAAHVAAAAASAPSSAPARSSPKAGRGGTAAGPPEFETMADGSTRLSIALSQSIPYDAKSSPGRLVYVLKAARAAHRNDYNPLVTVDFNTPVARARLTPHGRDLWFVVDLRASVKPDVTTEPAKDGGVVLQIAFPKGDYLPPSAPPPEAASSSH